MSKADALEAIAERRDEIQAEIDSLTISKENAAWDVKELGKRIAELKTKLVRIKAGESTVSRSR